MTLLALAVRNLGASPLTLDFEASAALRARILDVPGVRALAPRITRC